MGGEPERRQLTHIDTYATKPVGISDLRKVLERLFPECVPAAHEAAAGLRAKDAGEDLQRLNLRVLLAEDNVVNQKVACRILEKKGCAVAVAADGKQAVEAWEKGEFDLILMDVQMPEMDGFEASAAIRRREAERADGRDRIPIIALTAHAMREDEERCASAGMDGFISKPIQVGALIAAIAEICPRSRLEPGEPAPAAMHTPEIP
jgi:CheY-like chemotaxis protein